jgi:hypothetical protein
MTSLGKWVFIAGLVVAAIVALTVRGMLFPWLVAGLGIAVGLLNVKAAETRSFLIAGTALAVALMSIQVQPYNPDWLTYLVLYEKVFITHALLVVAVLAFFRTAKD